MNTSFESIYLINLKRRPDRLEKVKLLLQGHAFPEPIIFDAIDGSLLPVPPGWRAGGGAWGCRQSHVHILERCLIDGTKSVLVLEDDIVTRSTFCDDWDNFFRRVPDNWQCLMLGGQHMQEPFRIVDGVVKCTNCQRTHAYAVRGHFLRDLYAQWASPHQTQHIDWNFGPMQAYYPTYAPDPFLFGQSRSMSDICNRVNPTKFWQSPSGKELVLVLECDLATVEVLRSYGVHTGYNRDCNGIDIGLQNVFLSGDSLKKLRTWISDLQWECISEEDLVLGIWHPKASLDLVQKCWLGPTVRVKTLEDALPHLLRKHPQLPRSQTHVVLLKADKHTLSLLPFLHIGYWRDPVTGYDNGVRSWVENRSVEKLAAVIDTLAEEAACIKDGVACIWHSDVSLEEVKQAAGHRRTVLLEGNDYQEVLKQWSKVLAREQSLHKCDGAVACL